MAQDKMLVVYYSRTGNTEKVAQAIAGELACDIEEVVDKKERRGRFAFVAAGIQAHRKKLTQIEDPVHSPGDYGTVIIGTPVWAGKMSCAVRTYISRTKDALPSVAFFLTTGGAGIDSTFADMAEACGKEPVARLALKEKEVRRTEEWQERVSAFVKELSP